MEAASVECYSIVFEDAIFGVQAAHAAGNTFKIDRLIGNKNLILAESVQLKTIVKFSFILIVFSGSIIIVSFCLSHLQANTTLWQV